MIKITFRSKNISLIYFVVILFVLFMGDRAAQAFWRTGGPYGGDINCLAIAPNPDTIYAGTIRGLFKTADGGNTWRRTGFPKIPVRTIQVSPEGQCQIASGSVAKAEQSNVVYVGTDGGVYKSQDGGNTWDLKGLLGDKVNTIAIDPLNPCVIYAGTGDDDPGSTSIGKIFKSTDGGEVWQEKVSSVWMNAVRALLIDSDNSDYIYAGAYGSYGFWKSTDGGEIWVRSKIGPYLTNEVSALSMPPAGYSPKVIYAIAGISGDNVYKSTDQGESWLLTNAPSQSRAIAFDPNNPDVIYSCNQYYQGRFYKSTDAGNTWSVKDVGLPRGGIYGSPSSIVINPQNSALYVGIHEGGVFKSTDGADNWSFSSSGITGWIDIANLAVHPAWSSTVFAAVKADGHCLVKTNNGGSSWEWLPNSSTNLGAVAVCPENPQILWAGDGLQGDRSFYVYKSTDGGKSWTDKMFFYFSGYDYTGVTDILIKANAPDSILVGTDFLVAHGAIYGEGMLARTIDGGNTWERLGGSTTTLATDPTDPNVVYRAKRRIGEVFRHTEVWGSITTTEITPAGGIGDVSDIEVDSDSTVYVAASDGLWKWDGSDWVTLNGLSTNNLTALAIDRSTSPGIVYVGTAEDGVFVSKDGGSTWLTFNGSLGNLSITKLVITVTQPKMLYAGTSNGGVWSRRLSPMVMPAMPWIPVLLLDD